MNRIKFKYLKGRKVWIDEMEDFDEVKNPLPYTNLPEGEYMIRGNQKSYRKEYWQVEGRWFLISDVIKDNGHRICDVAIYHLFPYLPEKEWEQIGKIGFDRLKDIWREYYVGHLYWLQFRNTRREARKARYEILGK